MTMALNRAKTNSKSKKKQSLLPLWLVLAGIGLFLFAAWVFSNSSTQTKTSLEVKGAPRLKIDQDKIDHGDVKLGIPIRDTVRVTNTGDQPLLFSETPFIQVKEGC
jgi:hypothetical protein